MTKAIAIISKNLDTGVTIKYSSIAVAERTCNITAGSLSTYLKGRRVWVGVANRCIFKYVTDNEWPAITSDNTYVFGLGHITTISNSKKIKVTHAVTGVAKEYTSIRSACIATNTRPSLIYAARVNNHSNYSLNGYLFEFM